MSVTIGAGSGLERGVGNFALIDTLHRWGIRHYCGVGGGALINLIKYLEPLTHPSQISDGIPRMLSIGEYAAGFMPLGYYLASGRIAGAVTVTGAASRIVANGMSEAKLHNIPAIYLMGLNPRGAIGRAPLQDVSEFGMNLIPQLVAELGDGAIVIDDIGRLEEDLVRAQRVLQQSRPVAIAFHPEVLGKNSDASVPLHTTPRAVDTGDVEMFLEQFPAMAKGRRVVIYVSEEAAFAPNIQELSTRLANVLRAPVVWSVNGANAVSPGNPWSYGYILFGGNDRAIELWRSLGENDLVITLGFDPGEYALGLDSIPAGCTWHFGGLPQAYGTIEGGFRHRCTGDYRRVRGDIGLALQAILPKLEKVISPESRPKINQLCHFNTREIFRDVRNDCVDFMKLYEELPKYWRPHSIGFDDVCVSYKDRQYVTQRPHPNIRFWTMHNGSAMGGAYGLGIGAKLADPSLHTFIFSGDGCFRLYGGCLADAAQLDLRLFVINNESYAIVDKGLASIIPTVDRARYHGKIPNLDFVAVAKAQGWEGFRLKPDLSNLPAIMDACYTRAGRSILVEVPMDVEQEIGPARPAIWGSFRPV